ncbi:MAG: hypothetical protein CL881_06925 [Dehalococcoidia bacterium]|nr:hypothetical protein [Dehalococcoidia bacterium]
MWCWWCCHDFDSTPLSMPFRHDERRNIFHTSGNFCSWSCMKSYAIDKYGLSRGGLICGNIVMMRKKMFNQIGSVKPAPDRFRLKEFGGDMTIEDFRKNQTLDEGKAKEVDNKPYEKNVVPFVSNTKRMNEIKNASSDNNALKLKRSKPLKRSHNNLESALGLVITPKT